MLRTEQRSVRTTNFGYRSARSYS